MIFKNSSLNKQDTLLFLHIPKTAGRTFEAILERNYPGESIYNIYGDVDERLKQLERLSDNDKRILKLVKGHYCFGVHEFLPQQVKYVTFLRDPVNRVISHYNYILRDEGHELHTVIRENKMSFRDYFENRVTEELYNGQTRQLAGVGIEYAPGECDPELLARARKNLDEHFPVVGLLEYFDESLALMGMEFSLKHLYYRRLNVSRAGLKRSGVDAALLKAIEKYNRFDLELYRYALDKFERRVSNNPPYLKRLKRIRLGNSIYQPAMDGIYYLYEQARRLR